MSYSPKALGRKLPTGVVRTDPKGLRFGSAKLANFSRLAASSPEEKRVVVPARHAYSHSASVGKRYVLPSFLVNQAQKAAASFQLTLTTGWRSVCSFHQLSQVNSGLRAK